MKIVCDCLDTETYDSTTSGDSSDSESSSSSSSSSSSDDSSSSSSGDASSSSNENSSSNSPAISGPYIKSITSNTTANNETQLTITTSTGTNVITIPSATITNFSASKTAVGHKLSLALNNTAAKTVSLNYDASSVAVSSNVSPIKNCQYLNQALDVLAKNASGTGSGSSTKITSFEITSGSLNTDKIYETLPKTTTLTLSWSIYNTPNKVLLCYGDDEIDVTDQKTADITVTATTAGIIDITLACFTGDSDLNDVLIDSKTLSIQVGDPYYYGFSSTAPSSSSTATFIKTLTKHLQLVPETGPLVLDCKNNTAKYWSFVSPYKVYILNAGSIVTGLTEHTVSFFLTDTNNGYDNMYIYTFPYKFNNNIVVEIIKV